MKPMFCGGLKIDDTLELVDGIITVAGETPDRTHAISPCGQLFDGEEFEVVKHKGANILTSIGVDEEMDMPAPIKTNCSFAFDPRYFSLGAGKKLGFDDSGVIEVVVSPADATIAVTYGDADTPVEPLAGTTNIFKLTELEQTYTVTVSKEGYTTQQQDIDDNTVSQIVEITLQAAQG